MKKVLWVKFGWSDYYRGGRVDGDFSWIKENAGRGDGRRGHEAFNFNPSPDGTYHCYVPPQGGEHAPSHDEPDGWTVICLAKNPKHPGIHIVGWYEDATLHGEWLEPPGHNMRKRGDTVHPAYDWSYCITSKNAYFIPPQFRNMPFSDSSIRIGKYSFLEGPGIKPNDNKRRVLKLLEGRMKLLRPFAVSPDNAEASNPELDPVDPLKGFGTPEHRKEVEIAAEQAVIRHYKSRGYACERLTHLACGYDFLFTKAGSELHVEVKGTSSSSPQFFLTKNEHATGFQSDPLWRLVMVTSALSAKPGLVEYNAADLTRAFDLVPYVYLGRFIAKPGNEVVDRP